MSDQAFILINRLKLPNQVFTLICKTNLSLVYRNSENNLLHKVSLREGNYKRNVTSSGL